MDLFVETDGPNAERVITHGFVAVHSPYPPYLSTEDVVEFLTEFPRPVFPVVLRIDVPAEFVEARLVRECRHNNDHLCVDDGPHLAKLVELTVAEANEYLPTLTAFTNDGDELPLEAVNR